MKRFLSLISLIIICSASLYPQLKVDRMYTENLKNPLGLDNLNPRFTWIIISEDRQVMQSAYEVRVGLSSDKIANGENLVWNTGKIVSENSVHISYDGKDLLPVSRYYWQVRVWDNKGNVSDWSNIEWWQTGLMNSSGWQADWISAEEREGFNTYYFRKDFNTPKKKTVKKAFAYITAKGMYEASLNGERISDIYFTPGWTSYNSRIQYQVYDITGMLKKGKNTIGVILGEGWYKGRISRKRYGSETGLIAQLKLEYDDGSIENINTDNSWQTSTGPIIISDIYDGEVYDSRREFPGWNKPGYKSTSWTTAIRSDFSKKEIVGSNSEPVRKHEKIEPKEIFKSPEGDLLVDFGQNLVGWVELSIKGEKGDTVTLYHAEVLDREGNFYTDNLRAAKARNIYILNGEDQVFEPHFTWQGFRYLKIEGLEEMPSEDNFRAYALYSDLEKTGRFLTSNEDINQLQENIEWGQKGNFIDVPTDCPQRDERYGWTGDAQAFALTAAYNMHVNNFFAKWLKDLSADQLDDGNVPVVIPHVLGNSTAGSAGWSDAATIVPWNMYQTYGDIQILEDQYASMKAWVDYLVNISNDLLRNNGFHFGDWLFYSEDNDNSGRSAVTDKSLMAQCFFANSARIVSETADLLDEDEDYKYYAKLVNDVKKVFNSEFVTPGGQLVSNTQTAYVLALNFDMLPDNLREEAAKRLVNNIRTYGHITTGFLGTPYINHVLTSEGYLDVAFELLLRDKYPSWLYPVRKGATTIWERWNGIKPDGTFQYPSMNSFNHYAYGAIGDWMYQVIAGIRQLEPGYKRFMIKPQLGGEFRSARGELLTYYGLIRSDWRIEEERFLIDIEVPVNTTAELFLPTTSARKVMESGKQINDLYKVILDKKDGTVGLILGSGKYSFEIELE